MTYEEVLEQAQQLSPIDKARLMEVLGASLYRDLAQPAADPQPNRSLLGIWEDVNISAEDIAEARREVWGNFPREDI